MYKIEKNIKCIHSLQFRLLYINSSWTLSAAGGVVEVSFLDYIDHSTSYPAMGSIRNSWVLLQDVCRNPLIANVFFRAGLIEILGKGTLTLIEETEKAWLPEPSFNKIYSGIEEVFSGKLDIPRDTPQLGSDLAGLEDRILGLISEDASISRREISESLSIGKDTIKEYVRRLKVKGQLTRVGGNTGAGYWELN